MTCYGQHTVRFCVFVTPTADAWWVSCSYRPGALEALYETVTPLAQVRHIHPTEQEATNKEHKEKR